MYDNQEIFITLRDNSDITFYNVKFYFKCKLAHALQNS